MDVEDGFDPWATINIVPDNDGEWVRYEEAADQIERLREALQELHDWQNGPPLLDEKWLTGWGNAMKKAEACLGLPTLPHQSSCKTRKS